MTIGPVETATVVYEVKDADGPHISSFDFSFSFDAANIAAVQTAAAAAFCSS